jgi:chromosome segregation ATPase
MVFEIVNADKPEVRKYAYEKKEVDEHIKSITDKLKEVETKKSEIESKLKDIESKIGSVKGGISMDEVKKEVEQIQKQQAEEIEKAIQNIHGKKLEEVCTSVECLTKELSEIKKKIGSMDTKLGLMAIDLDDLLSKHYYKCPNCGERTLSLGDKECKNCKAEVEWE